MSDNLLKITRNATGECEAEAVMEALDTKYAGLQVMLQPAEDRLLHCVSSSTDMLVPLCLCIKFCGKRSIEYLITL